MDADFTFEAPCSSFGDSKTLTHHVKRIHTHLVGNGWNHNTFLKGAASDNTHWPTTEDKRAYNQPICFLLNDAIQGFSADETAKGASYHASQGLLFSVNERPTATVQTATGVKPDIVGCHGKPPEQVAGSRKENIKAIALGWGKTEIAVEVTNDASLVIVHATTYARALILSRKSRLWALVITFNLKIAGVRFNFFHRGGLMSTEVCDLKMPEGFSDFTYIMAFVLSWKSNFEAGMDPTRDNVRFWLPTIGEFVYARELCHCTALWGRGTEVVLLKKCADGQADTSSAQAVGQDTTQRVTPGSPPSRTPSGTKRRAPSQPRGGVIDGNNEGGSKSRNKRLKMMEESAPSKTSITEEDVIKELASISRERNNPGPLEEPSVYLLDRWYDGKVPLAICPPLCVFKDSWPSSKHKTSERDMFKDTQDMFGFLTDGDHAIKWKETRGGVPYGSGTTPFMSLRALEHCMEFPQRTEQHTAIDDLESFMWLLTWCLLQAGHIFQCLSMEEQLAYKNFNSSSYTKLVTSKYQLIRNLERYDSSVPWRINAVAFLAPFMGILEPWANTINKAQDTMGNIVVRASIDGTLDHETTRQAMEDLCLKSLNDCINTGLKEVERIKENWNDYM